MRAWVAAWALVIAGCKTSQSSPAQPAPSASTLPGTGVLGSASGATADVSSPACPRRRFIDNVEWSRDGKLLATSCATRNVEPPNQWVDIWDLVKGAWVHSVDAGMTGVTGRWAPGGWFVTIADPSTGVGHVGLFSETTWASRYETDFYCIVNVDFDPEGRQMFIAGCNGVILRIDTSTAKTRARPEQDAHVNGDVDVFIQFLGKSGPLFVLDENAGAQLLDPSTLRLIQRDPRTFHASPSPDGTHLAVVTEKGGVEVLRTRTLAREKVLLKPNPEPMSRRVAWLGSERLLVHDPDGSVTLLPLEGGAQQLLPVPLSAPCGGSERGNPAGKLVAVVDSNCKLALWDVASGSFRWSRSLLPAVVDPKVSPDPELMWSPAGDLLAVIPWGEPLQIFNADGVLLRQSQLGGAVSAETGIQWSPDGEFLAMSHGDVRLLRVRDGEELTLALFEDEKGPETMVVGRTTFAGKSSLARCIAGARPASTERPGLLADFFAQRPLVEVP